MHRVVSDGKHLSVSSAPFRVRGATWGTFEPRGDGALFPPRARSREDLEAMAEAGLNTVRTYTVPPDDVLAVAGELGLRLIVGLDYRDWRMEPTPGRAASRRVLDAGRRAVVEAMERLAGRPEVLAVSVGNEVPGDIVRVHGISSIERTLSRLVADVHDADPEMLACYVNFPTTEYLHVDGQDLACFNVFLERPELLRRYLRHLQIVVGDVPLVVTELGLASEIHGEDVQARALEWQLRVVDETGCAGATVFSWTDEWHVGGNDVEGWGFGLTDIDRRPKPALEVVSEWAGSSVADLREEWPRISAVVCAYNAAATIEECLASLVASDYPDLEVILCDDGSKDGTLELARRYPVRILELSHGGLSAARNMGIAASSGEIVAFLDSDAACHPEWPYHLALSMEDEHVVATGGPNLPVAGAGFVERAVAASPGGPIHVLYSDDRAEHVPGCNMAFRREALEEVGYFDPVYTAAGDDVDVCWKLLDYGHEIAFSPAAQVRHHRRASVRAYLRQQLGYGRAERLMASRHRHRFNRLGQARWAGFIYGGPRFLARLLRPVVYHGSMGTAPFQSVVRRRSEVALAWTGALLPALLPLLLLGMLAPLSLAWLAAPAGVLAALVAYVGTVALAARPARGEPRPLKYRLLVAALHVAQPLVRTWGRLRSRDAGAAAQPTPSPWIGVRTSWLDSLARDLAARGCKVEFSEAHEGWDLEARKGPFLRARVTTAVLWHWLPSFRLAYRPRASLGACAAAAAALALFSLYAGLGALALVVLALAVEALVLVRSVRRSVRSTTRGATVTHEFEELEHVLRPSARERAPESAYAREPL